MTLPDNSFFELLRSVFGKIKTPFNKQLLMNDLELFLSKEEIQKNIACYIDHNDARVIAAVAALGEPAPGELESFFAGELSYAELHDLVVNLEERFIFYRFREQGLNRLALNPVLEPVLDPLVSDLSLIFPSVAPADALGVINGGASGAQPLAGGPVMGDRILAGLLSFVSDGALFFKAEGELRKRIIDAGQQVFPGLELEPVIGGLRVLGLLSADEDRLVPDYRLFSDFGKLSRRERMEYCAAGIYCFRNAESPEHVSHHLFRSQVRAIAGFIRRFLDALEAERLYPVNTLKRLADILEHRNPDSFGGQEKPRKDRLIEEMERCGLLAAVSPEYRRLPEAGTGAARGDTPLIVMDTPFSCMVYPEISYDDLISLASVFSIREAGITVRFEMTRDSAVRAFDCGFSAGAVIELLNRLSGNRIDETLSWTLRDWEKRYGEVSLCRGLVLSLSPERRYLAETQPLARLIMDSPAPGIYLLPEQAEAEAEAVLRTAGVDIMARRRQDGGKTGSPQGSGAAGGRGGTSRGAFPPLDSEHEAGLPLPDASPSAPSRDKADAGSCSTLIGGFRSILEQMRLSKAEQDELAARIDRRLVLCEAQLRDASVRYEKLEARGLDYVGKVMIAKQAIALQAPVELVCPALSAGTKDKAARQGKTGDRVFGIPRALEKEGGESILVINPLDSGENPPEGPLRIPLGKISLLRRIKKSIFENNSGSAGSPRRGSARPDKE